MISSPGLIPDPDDDTVWMVGSATEPHFGMQVGVTILQNVHSLRQCAGQACVVHNPSDHHMRDWPLNWRDDVCIMERLCPAHKVGHPDPDDSAYRRRRFGPLASVHGCCGCCLTARRGEVA